MASKAFHWFTIAALGITQWVVWTLPLVGLPFWLFRRRNPVWRALPCKAVWKAKREAKPKVMAFTGTFHSGNWVVSHIKPIANSRYCGKIYVVAEFDIPPIERVVHVRPSNVLRHIIGLTGARFCTFAWICITRRPHVIGGFHFLFNGLYSLLLAKLLWAKSLYFCVGGPAEFEGGGLQSENRYFQRLGTPNTTIENQLLKLARQVDLIVTMGSRAARFLQNPRIPKNTRAPKNARVLKQKNCRAEVAIIPGFANVPSSYVPAHQYDVIFVGRFSPIKRLDILLDAVALLKRDIPAIRVVLVGQGELYHWVQQRIAALNLGDSILLAGYQSSPADWFRRSKIMVLCSDSEGLSLALMESGCLGLPAVVSDVGDLGDLVEDGINGYLVKERTPENFAASVQQLLLSESLYRNFSREAKKRASRFSLQSITHDWDGVFSKLFEQDCGVP